MLVLELETIELCRMQRSWQLLLSRCIVTPMLMRDAFLKGLILFFIFLFFFTA